MLRVLGTFGAGVALGLAWGVAARGFMRLITTSPEFSWEGTLSIVLSAGVIGGLVALVRLARRSGRSRWWRLLGLPFLLLFLSPGMLLLPGGRRRGHAARPAALAGAAGGAAWSP